MKVLFNDPDGNDFSREMPGIPRIGERVLMSDDRCFVVTDVVWFPDWCTEDVQHPDGSGVLVDLRKDK